MRVAILYNNEAYERGNKAVEELQDSSKEVVQDIYLYYRNQIANKYKIEEKELNKIVHRDVRNHDEYKKVELRIYYNNKKVKNIFIKNTIKPAEDYNVVYQFNYEQQSPMINIQAEDFNRVLKIF